MINYDNLIFITGIKNFDSLKRFGTLYNLLLILLNEEISTFKAAREQKEIIRKNR